MKHVTFYLTLCLLGACGRNQLPQDGQQGSSLSAISMVLPSKSEFSSSSELQAKLSGAELSITNSGGANCTQLHAKSKQWLDHAALDFTESIAQTCDYVLIVRLGELTNGTGLTKVYYEGEESLSQAEIQDKSRIGVDIEVNPTEEAKALGFNGSVQIRSTQTDVEIGVRMGKETPPSQSNDVIQQLENGNLVSVEGSFSHAFIRGVSSAGAVTISGSNQRVTFAINERESYCPKTVFRLKTGSSLASLQAEGKRVRFELRQMACEPGKFAEPVALSITEL